MHSARVLSVDAERRDERGENDHSHICEQFGNLANASNILGALLRREAEILAEAMSHIVAVESIRRNPKLNERFLEAKRDRRLAGARQSREPECTAAKARVFAER